MVPELVTATDELRQRGVRAGRAQPLSHAKGEPPGSRARPRPAGAKAAPFCPSRKRFEGSIECLLGL